MLFTYLHSFTLDNGRQVFVPSPESRATGKTIKRKVHAHWRVPTHFFHLRKGGHVAALKRHLPDTVFATLDVAGFFDSITRTKAYRALISIGLARDEALETVRQSLVEKTKKKRDFSLPYGFVQSPILASVVLDRSALGQELRRIAQSNHTRLSCYVDDIILSGTEVEDVERVRLDLIKAAEQSRFQFNQDKSQLPALEVEVFNVRLSHNAMRLTDARMADFVDTIHGADVATIRAIIDYVDAINPAQSAELRALSASSLLAAIPSIIPH